MHIFLTIDGMTTTQYVCFILFLFFEPFIEDLFTDGTKMMLENELWTMDYKDIMAPSTFLFWKFFITFIVYILVSLKDTLSRLPTASNCVSYFYE